jgi:toxin ParE1/3/4
VAERSPAGAAKTEARMSALLELVRLQPHTGHATRVAGVRRIFLIPYPYLIDYQIEGGDIVVLRFRHTSRDPSQIPGKV